MVQVLSGYLIHQQKGAGADPERVVLTVVVLVVVEYRYHLF